MTDDQPFDTTPHAAEPMADEPIPDAPGDGTEAGTGGARAREWLNQLEAMIQDIATQAAPVARQVGAKAAELAAVAAVKAGPIAHKAADVTTDYGQRFAERAQSVAAELRGEGSVATAERPEGAVATAERPVEPADEPGDGSPMA